MPVNAAGGEPVRIQRLRLRNASSRRRRLTVIAYAEWVLGTVRENAPLQVVCERDPESAAILARNAWAGDFAEKIAFAEQLSKARLAEADAMSGEDAAA